MRAPNTALTVVAAILFVSSFALPAVDFAPGRRPARGWVAAPYAACVLPLALQALGDTPRPGRSRADEAYAVAAGAYLAALALANIVAVYVFLARSGRVHRIARAAVTGCALLVWGVPLVDYARVYRVLGLADAEHLRLLSGYYAWALSFGLLAAAGWGRAAVSDPPAAAA